MLAPINSFSFSLSVAFFLFNGLLFFANKPNCFTTYCVTIVQQQKQHFCAKSHHSVKLVRQKRVKSIIVLYNSKSNTFPKIHSLLVQLVKPKISVNNYLNVMNREDIILHRNCIMLINYFQRQKGTYLRALVFVKKVVCTYGNKKRNSNHE